MRLSDRLERIFSHAVALQQSGRLKSTIYCIGKAVYILNQDHTVLIRFLLRGTDKVVFEEAVSFNANDYDSQHIDVRGDKICFIQEEDGFERVKSCRTPDMTPREVRKLFKGLMADPDYSVMLSSSILKLIDESLSHIEFSCDDGKFLITQRNIYSGSIIKISPTKKKGMLIGNSSGPGDFDPVGIRTNDFLALFTFVDSLQFNFLEGGTIMVVSTDPKMPMKVFISKCKYDELGTTE